MRLRTCVGRSVLAIAAVLLPAPVLGTPGPQWVEQGPGPNTVSGPGYTEVSGAVQSIAADPNDPNRVFIATVNGGIWRTTNATAMSPTWVALTDQAPSLSTGTIALSPLDSNILFAGFRGTSHGAPLNGTASGPFPGVIKTTDGGTTWTLLGQNEFGGQPVLRALPTTLTTTSGQVVFVATVASSGIDGPGGGVYRSDDGGQTWQRKSGANGLPDFSFVDIVQDPGNSQRFFTATDNPPRVFMSEDTGETWSQLTSIGLPTNTYNPTRLAMSPTADASGHHWLYILADGGPGIFLSSDAGTTWTQLDQPPDGSRFAAELAVNTTAPSIVFAASDSAKHWRGDTTKPSGMQWYQVDFQNAGGTGTHTDGRDWVVSADPNVMFESDDGGIYRLRNALSMAPVWESAIGNLRVTEFLSIAYDSVNHIIFGACWDNSIPQQTTPGSIAWGLNEDFYGDGMQVGVDNTTTPGAAIHYSSQQSLFHARRRTYTSPTNVTTDEGLQLIINGTGGVHYNAFEGAINVTDPNDLGTIRMRQSFAVNAADGTRVLFGTDYLYESSDRGDHFDSLGGVAFNVNNEPEPSNPVGTVTAYAYGHAQNADALYVGTSGNSGGHLLWARGVAGYPNAVGTYEMVGGGVPWAIAMSPSDWRTAYLVTADGRAWRTTDAGATIDNWSEITGSSHSLFPLGSLTGDLRTIEVFNPTGTAGHDVVIVGGFGGVFLTRNPGAGERAIWRRYGDNFPNVIVTDLHYAAADDVLVAGTYGRGAWTVSNAGQTLATNEPPICEANGPYTAECAGASTAVTLNASNSIDPDGESLSFTWTGPFIGGAATGTVPTVRFSGTGTSTVNLAVSDASATSTCTSSVTIRDTTPPMIPADTTIECTSPLGSTLPFGTPTDICDANPTFSNNAPAILPFGSTPVTWMATDHSGNTSTGTQIVTVQDTTPPALTISVSPATLWPPNHQLANVHVSIAATDLCDPAPKVRLVSIASSEPDSGTGLHDIPNDIQGASLGTDDRTFQLRAEHSPGGMRTYTITYEAEDAHGNTTTGQAQVRVPKSGATLISRNIQPANGASRSVSINGDGSFVAFSSDATNLVPGDTNQVRDIFVRDRKQMMTERVSVSSSGAQANGASQAFGGAPAVSADGTIVAFDSIATNLVALDANGEPDVFVRDRVGRTTERVSVDSSGAEGNGPSLYPSISDDGTLVAFQSIASNLVGNDTNGVADIFVRDRVNHTTERPCDTVQANDFSFEPSISADGKFVAFASAATNLVAGDSNGYIDVFVCNRATGSLELVSISTNGKQGNGDSTSPAISKDGRFVAFTSTADNLAPGDDNRLADVFVRDRFAGTTERITVNRTGGDSNDVSFAPSISHDGRFVAFASLATNLVSHDTNTSADVFVRDRGTGSTFVVDVNDDGELANRGTLGVTPALSGDGAQVGFVSEASNLAGTDNEVTDVFVVYNPFLGSSSGGTQVSHRSSRRYRSRERREGA